MEPQKRYHTHRVYFSYNLEGTHSEDKFPDTENMFEKRTPTMIKELCKKSKNASKLQNTFDTMIRMH